jgi:hypothetical protein
MDETDWETEPFDQQLERHTKQQVLVRGEAFSV